MEFLRNRIFLKRNAIDIIQKIAVFAYNYIYLRFATGKCFGDMNSGIEPYPRNPRIYPLPPKIFIPTVFEKLSRLHFFLRD